MSGEQVLSLPAEAAGSSSLDSPESLDEAPLVSGELVLCLPAETAGSSLDSSSLDSPPSLEDAPLVKESLEEALESRLSSPELVAALPSCIMAGGWEGGRLRNETSSTAFA